MSSNTNDSSTDKKKFEERYQRFKKSLNLQKLTQILGELSLMDNLYSQHYNVIARYQPTVFESLLSQIPGIQKLASTLQPIISQFRSKLSYSNYKLFITNLQKISFDSSQLTKFKLQSETLQRFSEVLDCFIFQKSYKYINQLDHQLLLNDTLKLKKLDYIFENSQNNKELAAFRAICDSLECENNLQLDDILLSETVEIVQKQIQQLSGMIESLSAIKSNFIMIDFLQLSEQVKEQVKFLEKYLLNQSAVTHFLQQIDECHAHYLKLQPQQQSADFKVVNQRYIMLNTIQYAGPNCAMQILAKSLRALLFMFPVVENNDILFMARYFVSVGQLVNFEQHHKILLDLRRLYLSREALKCREIQLPGSGLVLIKKCGIEEFVRKYFDGFEFSFFALFNGDVVFG